MNEAASEYQGLAAQWQSIDYEAPESVDMCNKASDHMRQIVLEAKAAGPDAMRALIALRDGPIAAK